MILRGAARKASKGSMLVEFSFAALILYLLLAAILTFGRMLFVGQTTTSAVDAAARELARNPLPAMATFEEVRDNTVSPSSFRTDTYSEDYLVIDISGYLAAPGGMSLLEYLDSINIPRINRMLVPVMQIQEVAGDMMLRYPGALITSATAPSGYTVVVPVVTAQANDGTTTVEFLRVLEEIDTELNPGDNSGASPDPFLVTSAEGGLVALRLNYPFQSASMQGSLNQMQIIADDSLVSSSNAAGGLLVDPMEESGPNAGLYGLGLQFSGGNDVRPFRRVISTQAIYPREIFE